MIDYIFFNDQKTGIVFVFIDSDIPACLLVFINKKTGEKL
jgi:hypothetical protein